MLDADTKRRIDTARDILVGKLPDPKTQVEQITIALIYKFMDDMDKQSEELGGKAKFFTGEYEKYAWSRIFDSRISGHELVGLYGEAIQRMNQNPNIPQLFRDIFKNAYLPYRDPETLKGFLKTIDDFEYDHSEKLGDAFEYLLSIMGSQGDAGQFRTPRHIIDFIVKVVNPTKDDLILDPACGTAGFLISAYKHILESNVKDGHSSLTPDQRKRLTESVVGYDISPDMVRLSLVNLYLHGFTSPKIAEYDTLTSEEKWNEYFDVVLANPPFMSPKGGIRPHKRFSVQANRSEVLFVDYIHEHLTPNGRAGIVVPEGIIFQSGNAYKSLRKMLLEQSLYAVVSLPAGVFNPYSGVKTSVLIMDKTIAKRTNKILFVKVGNDGYGLGAQRREVKNSDLPLAIEIIKDYQKAILSETEPSLEKFEQTIAHIVEKEKIVEQDYNLSGDRYKEAVVYDGNWDLVELGEVCEIVSDKPPEFKDSKKYFSTGSIDKGSSNGCELVTYENKPSRANVYPTLEDVGFAVMKGTNKVIFIDENLDGSIFSTGFSFLRANKSIILPKYLFSLIIDSRFQNIKDELAVDGIMGGIRKSDIPKIKIPLPPLEVQEKIVEEIESYQNIIDGAKKVVESYKPSFKIENDWDVVELGNIIKLSSGNFLPKTQQIEGQYEVYGGNGILGTHNKYFIEEKTLIIGRVGAYCGVVHITNPKSWITDNALYVSEIKKPIELVFLKISLDKLNLNKYAKVGGQPSISQSTVLELKIPLPPIETQKEIVAKIEEEQKLVDSNKQLIEIFEKKVKDKISEVWGE